jgi:uncharacterized membrane protein
MIKMSEDKQAAIVIGLVFLVGIAGFFLTAGLPGVKGLPDLGIGLGDVYVDSYRADLYLNGTLAEQFVYQIKESGKYRMLYRNWKMTLSSQRQNDPYVEPLEIVPPSGAIAYITDWRGNATLITPQSSQYKGNVQSLAEINEAGSYMPQRFAAGRYEVDYLFRVHPFLECDQEYCHWNLKLADEHLPYRQASVYIHDPDNLLAQVFPHPDMKYQK